MRRSSLILTVVATAFTAGLITQPTFPKVTQPDPVSTSSVSWPVGPHTAVAASGSITLPGPN